jgi:hypothetical protein
MTASGREIKTIDDVTAIDYYNIHYAIKNYDNIQTGDLWHLLKSEHTFM